MYYNPPMTDSSPHKRIDAGIKRGPRKQIDRRPKAALTGQFISKTPEPLKQQILEDCLASMLQGETSDQIAARHGIPGRTLRYWLLDDPRADQARRQLINGELTRTLEEMREAKDSDSPLPLACAREEFRAWSWIAERRESRLYGQRLAVENQSVIGNEDKKLLSDASELLGLFKARVKPEEKLIESVPAPKLGDA